MQFTPRPNRIERMYAQGFSVRAIHVETGVSIDEIYSVLRGKMRLLRSGVARPAKEDRWMPHKPSPEFEDIPSISDESKLILNVRRPTREEEEQISKEIWRSAAAIRRRAMERQAKKKRVARR